MDILKKSGEKVVLLGNEAIARGALEAGVGVFAAYPGTPSSEVPMTIARVAKKRRMVFEYASNEKVAFETAAGAALSGVRAMTAMKHFGLNVAADSISPIAYYGPKAGLVVLVADDPNGWSSAQSEQDTRYYARMFRMPMLEPSDPQEALDFTRFAFDLSEEFNIPVLIRTTTKVSHVIETVKLGKLKKPRTKGSFVRDYEHYYNIRPGLQKLHREVDRKLERIEKKYGQKLNKVYNRNSNSKIGIIASGVSYQYAAELSSLLGLKVPIAEINMTFPLSRKFIANFIKGKKAVLVLEELEPIVEEFVKQVAKEVNPRLEVHGKDMLPRYGEYTLELLLPVFEKIFRKSYGLDLKAHKRKYEKAVEGLPPRKPVMCYGCPHRSTFYAVKKVFGNTKNVVYPGDIGCYVLGIFEPFKMQDLVVSMGASVGIAHGITRVSGQEVVVFVGDSTFFHAAMPAIANLRFHDGKSPLVVVLDNHVTAMTGHQPHPGSGFTATSDPTKAIDIAEVAKALGAEVRVANSFNQKQLEQALRELREVKGPRVLVSRGECRLFWRRNMIRKGLSWPVFEVDQNKCQKCGVCTDEFSCPAITKDTSGALPVFRIDPNLCWGCSVCAQVCPYGAIRVKKEG